MKRNIALILAGGTGQRIGNPLPKQFIEVEGRPIIVETLSAFENNSAVTDIVVVCQKEWMNFVEELSKEYNITKYRTCAQGVTTGYDSLRAGVNGLLELCGDDVKNTVVLVHDSVRPLVPQTVISANIAMCRTKGNAISSFTINEALLNVDDEGVMGEKYSSREAYRLAQTPHTFFLGELREMIDEADAKGLKNVQSACVLAVQTGHTPLNVVPGSLYNFKITVKEDLEMYRDILNNK